MAGLSCFSKPNNQHHTHHQSDSDRFLTTKRHTCNAPVEYRRSTAYSHDTQSPSEKANLIIENRCQGRADLHLHSIIAIGKDKSKSAQAQVMLQRTDFAIDFDHLSCMVVIITTIKIL